MDSLCAVKILQSLFKADNVEHTLIPVDGRASLQQAFADQADQVGIVGKKGGEWGIVGKKGGESGG